MQRQEEKIRSSMLVAKAITDSSIRVRLFTLILMSTSLALVLAGISLFFYEKYQQRQAASRGLTAMADILAEGSTAALSFNDEKAATQTLSVLRGDSNVLGAIVFDKNNIPFAHYQRVPGTVPLPSPIPRSAGVYFENGALILFQPIRLGGETIGSIFLKSTDDVYARMWQYVGIVCLVMLLSLSLALLLSSGTQRRIANPITELSGLARRVSLHKDYGIRAIRSTGGEIGTLFDSFNDMLSQVEQREKARKAAVELLRESEERYALAARGANDGLWDWKLTTGEIYFSPRWNQMFGYSDSESWSTPEDWFSRIHPGDRKRVQAEAAAVQSGHKSEFIVEYRMCHKNGSYLWVLSRGIAIRDAAGNAIRMAGSQTDITEGKIEDPLTSLPNRLYFLDRLDGAIECSSTAKSLFAVLFIDLDNFKLVNDSLGHAAGDDLLSGVAARLRTCVRNSSGAEQNSSGSFVARLGGDEFAVFVGGVVDELAVVAIAAEILTALKVPFELGGRRMFASASIGIALSSSALTAEDLLMNADTAMYHAKAKGKSQYEIFNEQMRERAIARLEIETEFRHAIDSGQFVLHYQPEVLVSSRATIGYEALVRWNHPRRGFLGPNEFIGIAEQSDLIIYLGRWVLGEACRQMAEWHLKFSAASSLTVSVNLSPKQLKDPSLVQHVRRVLADSGLAPHCLKLEITESPIMENPEETLSILKQLRDIGVGLEIDDFGTGYSSLSHLHLLPFDTLKIDQSFVKEIGAGGEGADIVRTIVELARSLNMNVVAEGVETQEQLNALVTLGCKCAQGFYFSKPSEPGIVGNDMGKGETIGKTSNLLDNPDIIGRLSIEKSLNAIAIATALRTDITEPLIVP